MKHNLRFLKRKTNTKLKLVSGLIGGVLIVLIPFTNCEQSATNPVFVQETQTCLNDDKTTCFAANEDLIQLRILSAHPYEVEDTWKIFTISGSCNHGGHSDHKISWQLFQNSGDATPIAQSLGRIAASPQEGKCVNGRFFITVTLPCPGLKVAVGSTCTNRVDNTLRVKLTAFNNSGGEIPPQIGASVSLILTPKPVP